MNLKETAKEKEKDRFVSRAPVVRPSLNMPRSQAGLFEQTRLQQFQRLLLLLAYTITAGIAKQWSHSDS
jgi:hypothetical protein